MSLHNSVIERLKRVANVPVYVGQREGNTERSILINPVKMDELISSYEDLYAFTFSAWRNLPNAPECEPTFVLMWIISSEDYDVNHFTIAWPDATSNTFVHLWSIMDRLRTKLESNNAEWLLGPRNAVGYSVAMGMPGAADTYLYPSESIIPPHVEVFSANMPRMATTTLTKDYASYFDFVLSMKLSKQPDTIDPSRMAMNNLRNALQNKDKVRD